MVVLIFRLENVSLFHADVDPISYQNDLSQDEGI